MEPGAKAGKIWPYDDLPDVSSADSKSVIFLEDMNIG